MQYKNYLNELMINNLIKWINNINIYKFIMINYNKKMTVIIAIIAIIIVIIIIIIIEKK